MVRRIEATPHRHRIGSLWQRKRAERQQRLELKSLMWSQAHKDNETKEIIATGDYSLHPMIPIVAGDVLVQAFRYAHPALTTAYPAQPRDPHSLGSWTELIARLPKRKGDRQKA